MAATSVYGKTGVQAHLYRHRIYLIGERLRWQSCAITEAGMQGYISKRGRKIGNKMRGRTQDGTLHLACPHPTTRDDNIEKDQTCSQVAAHLLTAIINTRLLRKHQHGAKTARYVQGKQASRRRHASKIALRGN